MTFTHLPQLANFIRRHHYLFGGLGRYATQTILGRLNASISTSACVGATYEAWQHVPGGPDLRTLVTINRMESGAWEYREEVA